MDTADPKLVKLKAFSDNPDNFVSMDSIVLGVVKDENGVKVVSGSFSRGDVKLAIAELQYKFMQIMMQMDVEIAAQKQPKILTPTRTITDFAGGRRG